MSNSSNLRQQFQATVDAMPIAPANPTPLAGHCSCRTVSCLHGPGYRFMPKDSQLILDFLDKRIKNEILPYMRKIQDINLYDYNPEELARFLPAFEDAWYCFTPRNRRYPNGTRPNREAGDGYWKATGCDKAVKVNGVTVGYKRALVFYRQKTKTNWIMHEIRTATPSPYLSRRPNQSGENFNDDMKLDDWVVCRFYERKVRYRRDNHLDDDQMDAANTSDSVNGDDNDVLAENAAVEDNAANNHHTDQGINNNGSLGMVPHSDVNDANISATNAYGLYYNGDDQINQGVTNYSNLVNNYGNTQIPVQNYVADYATTMPGGGPYMYNVNQSDEQGIHQNINYSHQMYSYGGQSYDNYYNDIAVDVQPIDWLDPDPANAPAMVGGQYFNGGQSCENFADNSSINAPPPMAGVDQNAANVPAMVSQQYYNGGQSFGNFNNGNINVQPNVPVEQNAANVPAMAHPYYFNGGQSHENFSSNDVNVPAMAQVGHNPANIPAMASQVQQYYYNGGQSYGIMNNVVDDSYVPAPIVPTEHNAGNTPVTQVGDNNLGVEDYQDWEHFDAGLEPYIQLNP